MMMFHIIAFALKFMKYTSSVSLFDFKIMNVCVPRFCQIVVYESILHHLTSLLF